MRRPKKSGGGFSSRESLSSECSPGGRTRAILHLDGDEDDGRRCIEGGEAGFPLQCSRHFGRVCRNRYTFSKGGRSLDVDFSSWKCEHGVADVRSLLSLLDAPPSEVVFTLVLWQEKLTMLLESAAQDGPSLSVLLRVLSRACTCGEVHHLRHLLVAVTSKERFLQHVQEQMLCRRRTSLFWEQCVTPVAAVLEKAAQILTTEQKAKIFRITSVLLDVVNARLQEGKTVDLDVVQSVERTGLHLAGGSTNDLQEHERLCGIYTGNGDSDDKWDVLPEEFIRSRDMQEQNNETAFQGGAIATLPDYLKWQFLCLRRMFLAPLKNIIRQIQLFTSSGDAPAVAVYSGVKVGQVVCTSSGIGHKVLYNVAEKARGSTERQLQVGSMVCMSKDSFHNTVLGTVLWRSSTDTERGHIVVSFLNPETADTIAASKGVVMFEAPKFYKDYKYIFDVMKEFEESRKLLPFSQYIIQKQCNPSPPGYVDHNTVFDMKSLFRKRVFVHPLRDRSWPNFSESTLDSFQFDALHSVMSQDLALIEGMPGSGKAYLIQHLIRIILDNRALCCPPGPILLMALTAEVLDSLMCPVLEYCHDIARVDDSEDDMIKPFVLSRGKNSQEPKSLLNMLLEQHKKASSELKTRIALEQDKIRQIPSIMLTEDEVKCVMTDQHYRSLFFSLAATRGNVLSSWLQSDNAEVFSKFSSSGLKCLTDDEIRFINDVWSLDMESRYRLYNYWQRRYIAKRTIELGDLMQCFKSTLDLQHEVREVMHHMALKEAKIIGTTVSSLPKVWKSLQHSSPCIAIVFEARDIPEMFLFPIVTLNPRHLVLVSDGEIVHKNKDSLSVSLFERLLNQGVACSQLLGQHRFGPAITAVLEAFKRKRLTPRLEFYAPPRTVKGVTHSLQFISHNLSYDKNILVASTFEAELLVSLSKRLLLQGYRPSEIRILAGSYDQARLIESHMESPAPAAVTTMPTSQSKVYDIVLLSFAGSCPPLDGRESKEITLSHYYAMSSASTGLFAVGNIEYLSCRFPLWKDVRGALEKEDSVGPSLQLRCQSHPNKMMSVTCARDFVDVSEGGCDLPCEAKLKCGHTCPRKCHPVDQDHVYSTCGQPCKELLPCDHHCTGLCGERCPQECAVMVNVLAPCDHVVKVQCSNVSKVDTVSSSCREVCRKTLRRGVRCPEICGDCYASGRHSDDSGRIDQRADTTCTACALM